MHLLAHAHGAGPQSSHGRVARLGRGLRYRAYDSSAMRVPVALRIGIAIDIDGVECETISYGCPTIIRTQGSYPRCTREQWDYRYEQLHAPGQPNATPHATRLLLLSHTHGPPRRQTSVCACMRLHHGCPTYRSRRRALVARAQSDPAHTRLHLQHGRAMPHDRPRQTGPHPVHTALAAQRSFARLSSETHSRFARVRVRGFAPRPPQGAGKEGRLGDRAPQRRQGAESGWCTE